MKQIVHDFATEITTRRADEYRAAQTAAEDRAARARGSYYDGPTTFDVLNKWTFRPYEYQTLTRANGERFSLSMMVQDPQETTSTFVVTFFPDTGDWICFCPSFRKSWGEVVIRAVQMRIEENRRQRTIN